MTTAIVSFAGSAWLRSTIADAGLQLPHLRALLAGASAWIEPAPPLGEFSLSAPHERAWAVACGIEAVDGCVPLASALSGALSGSLSVAQRVDAQAAWARLTPVHWRLGTEQVSLMDPGQLQLDETDARALFDAARSLFEDAGFALYWLEPAVWLLRHPMLADLPCASLDRVIGRNVDLWLGSDARSRPLRRLQSEVQMLWHQHPVNEAREARGLDAVNSFWVDGCGTWPAGAQPAVLEWEPRLRSPALAGDEPAWRQAFEDIDASLFARLLQQARTGQSFGLWLCGERRFCHIRSSSAAELEAANAPVRAHRLPGLQAMLQMLWRWRPGGRVNDRDAPGGLQGLLASL